LLLILLVFVIFARRGGMQARAPSGRSMIELYELQLEEMKRSAAAMERIAQALETRNRA
jgi:hypothetical protein